MRQAKQLQVIGIGMAQRAIELELCNGHDPVECHQLLRAQIARKVIQWGFTFHALLRPNLLVPTTHATCTNSA